MKLRHILPLIATGITLVLYACETPVIHHNDEIQAAMNRYARFTREMNVDSIASMYADDGVMGGGTVGPKAIADYLKTQTNVHVMEYTITAKSINITGDSALWEGFFHQKLMNEKQDTFSLDGDLRARWYYDPKRGWVVRGMNSRSML